jgi:chemotaxis regulatin CheY-phosphate phosphatase CheZ
MNSNESKQKTKTNQKKKNPTSRDHVQSTTQHNTIKLTEVMRTQDYQTLSGIPEVLLPHVVKESMAVIYR